MVITTFFFTLLLCPPSKMSMFLPLNPVFCFIAPLAFFLHSMKNITSWTIAISNIICCSTTPLTSLRVLLFTCSFSPIKIKPGNVHMDWKFSDGHGRMAFLQREKENSSYFSSFFSWSSFQLVPEINCSGSCVAILW